MNTNFDSGNVDPFTISHWTAAQCVPNGNDVGNARNSKCENYVHNKWNNWYTKVEIDCFSWRVAILFSRFVYSVSTRAIQSLASCLVPPTTLLQNGTINSPNVTHRALDWIRCSMFLYLDTAMRQCAAITQDDKSFLHPLMNDSHQFGGKEF